MRNAEARIQNAIVDYLRTILPDWQVYANFNGGDLITKAEAAKRKFMGLKAGIPDVSIAGPEGFFAFLEIKTPAGRLSPEQIDFRDWCFANGHRWGIARSIDETRLLLTHWNVQTREAA